MTLCLVDEVPDHEVQAYADADKTTAMLPPDVVQIVAIVYHIRVALLHMVACALFELYHIRKRRSGI